ncbi:Glutamate receptor ionotropic, delta-1-like 27, partial [Homarus americanus]
NNWPFFGLRYLPDGKPLADSGLDISVLNSLSHKFNFTYVVAEPEDGQWGGPQPDGSVTGIIGMVARHEAHLAINEITITASREKVVDFTHPYFLESTILVSRAPAPKNKAFAIFSPFTPLMWSLLAATTALMGPLVWILTTVLRSYTNHEEQHSLMNTPIPPRSSVQDLAFNMYRSM